MRAGTTAVVACSAGRVIRLALVGHWKAVAKIKRPMRLASAFSHSHSRLPTCPLCAVIGRAEACQQLLRIEGMTCSACSSAVEAALHAVPGVHEAAVNVLSGIAEVGVLEVYYVLLAVHGQWAQLLVLRLQCGLCCWLCRCRGMMRGIAARRGYRCVQVQYCFAFMS